MFPKRQEIAAKWPAPNSAMRSPLFSCRSQNWQPRELICLRQCWLVLRAGEPGTEPRVNHCLPPPTQVTLALHMDTRICTTAFCSMPTAISLLMPYGKDLFATIKPWILQRKKVKSFRNSSEQRNADELPHRRVHWIRPVKGSNFQSYKELWGLERYPVGRQPTSSAARLVKSSCSSCSVSQIRWIPEREETPSFILTAPLRAHSLCSPSLSDQSKI